ncbi:2'-5' RNA ligase family protein [Brevundimonas lenta]|uniref:2'-5' RNA ligase n=1 Tax=Brevundimonas lenta TaxID=424796 RepID=A0A7W6JEN7_9CAUL|nr:2'-5' RNA ligase family protein [Brevundimonas lenta]MBB4083755.1 hypothetical protein [Brevundimonas lenta]
MKTAVPPDRLTRRRLVLAAGAAPLVAWSAGCGPSEPGPKRAARSDLLAVDVLLLPDAALIDRAATVNARLREAWPDGFALDEAHRPHITLLQRFVHRADVQALSVAVADVFRLERPRALRLRATGFQSQPWANLDVLSYTVEVSPALRRMHQQIARIVEPFTIKGGDAGAFAPDGTDTANPDAIRRVETFVPDASDGNFAAPVVVGVAPEAAVDVIEAERFRPFDFSIADAAIFHLGRFGAPAARLWSLAEV